MTEKVKRYMDFMGPSTRTVKKSSSDPLAARPVVRSASKTPSPKKPVAEKPAPIKKPAQKPLKTASPAKDSDALALKAAAALSGTNLKSSAPSKYTLNGKSPFLSSYNIEKRPLSDSIKEKKVEEITKKNVYKKEEKPVKKSKKEPVVVIDQPKKSSGLSLVIIILITILLGAAVGAGAYFLLPK